VADARLTIAQVTPFAWESAHDVNEYVARAAEELSGRGHRVLVIAPSHSDTLVRESRRALRGDTAELLARADNEPLVLGVGEVLPFAPARRRTASLPVDVARTIEEALSTLPLDIVHVHEPFAPSASSAALRHSRALNVGSFHAPTERVLSTQFARPLSKLLFGRLDARTATYLATRELMQRYFPAEYRLILRGGGAERARESVPGSPVQLFFNAGEERAALRLFLRALRALPRDADWRARVFSPRRVGVPATVGARLRERIEFVDVSQMSESEALAGCEVIVLASEGVHARPATLVRALAAGVVPVTSRLGVYVELLGEGRYGFAFEPGEVETLTAHLQRLIGEPETLQRSRAQIAELRELFSWSRVASELEEVYGELVARRHDTRADHQLRRRLSARPMIDVDLHMHTDHSYDCATPVEVLLAEARGRGLGAIAVTDHNEISGALEARAKAQGIKVIVGEEVKTAEEGEVIGLFIEEKIPRGMTLAQTIAEIKRQGGIVYVPHPFDRLHSVPDYEHLLGVLGEVDAIEVFNPRVAISEFNEEALRFAAKYRIPAGAGSDAHVPQGLGSVRIRMHDFDGPREFLESLRDADIVRNPASLLYVQALKFLQTKALPPAARKASRDRRVRRATGQRRHSPARNS
jgi:predicted metal-dependent phosphoesterase TrpH/glycosyltransferase involved in cell wall biosynthesis